MVSKRAFPVPRLALPGLTMFALLSGMVAAEARVIRFEIVDVQSPTADGQVFGGVGPYERIVGKAHGELDPNDPKNAIITDIQLAPRNARGMVEYVATFSLVKPIDMSKASGVLM